MFTLMGIGIVAMAVVFLVLGLVALLRCDRAAIPETVRALSSWLGYRGPIVPLTVRRTRVAPVEAKDIGLEVVPLDREKQSLDS